MGKTALVLSGGGAKGAFQAGAERYAREVKGYRWDIIAGVSVGELALGRWPTVGVSGSDLAILCDPN